MRLKLHLKLKVDQVVAVLQRVALSCRCAAAAVPRLHTGDLGLRLWTVAVQFQLLGIAAVLQHHSMPCAHLDAPQWPQTCGKLACVLTVLEGMVALACCEPAEPNNP